MKILFLTLLVGLDIWTTPSSQAQPSPVPPASQAEVNAGTVKTKYVSPATLHSLLVLPYDVNLLSTTATDGQVPVYSVALGHYAPGTVSGGVAITSIGSITTTNTGINYILQPTNTYKIGGGFTNYLGTNLLETGVMSTDGSIYSNDTFQVGSTNGLPVPAGFIADEITAKLVVGSKQVLATGADTVILTISLPPGIWDVQANLNVSATAAVNAAVFAYKGSIVVTTGVTPTDGTEVPRSIPSASFTGLDSVTITRKRVVNIATVTLQLLCNATFTGGSAGAYGYMTATRVH